MKLLGKDISTDKVMAWVTARLGERGLSAGEGGGLEEAGGEAAVDPLTFNLGALAEHADPTRALPLETHRGGLSGRAVLAAKRVFRATCQVFINETLDRQRAFNGHVRDSYAHLSAEVLELKARLAAMEAAGRAPPPSAPPAKKSAPRRKAS